MHSHVAGKMPPGDPDEPIRRGSTTKWVVLAVLAVLILFFVLQNRDRANVDFLFWDADLRLWVALLFAAGLGFVAGVILGRITKGRRHER
ncbi:MAG: LapA family protein [Actinomycetota bacterium]